MGFIENQIYKEEERQRNTVELIASENFPSERILFLNGSCLNNKYTEGYPEKRSIEKFQQMFPDYVHTGNIGRYYGGCENIDLIELYARYMFQKAFQTDYHVNVQPHSGSSANLAAYMSALSPGDKILAMSLNNGGHLTHGSSVNFSGKLFDFVFYNVDENGYIDYLDMAEKARKEKPKLILAGASAYPRIIDFTKFRQVADEVGAYFMVDMAHIAGLIAAGDHPSPFGLADIITTTTHKTLRGSRGAVIFCKPELAKKIDSAVFPCCQGGSLQHVIAAKAATAEEACGEDYRQYIHSVVKNTRVMCEAFKSLGYDVVTGGTDNHLFLLDFSRTHPNVTGRMVQDALDEIGITLNKNCVPNETRRPTETSGVRIGCAAETTKGKNAEDFVRIAYAIHGVIQSLQSAATK